MNFKDIAIASLGLLSLWGCGKSAKAKKMEVVAVSAPAAPDTAQSVFSLLTDARSQTNYTGTMLILNPTGSPQQLAKVIGASEITRIKAADSRTFVLKEAKYLVGGSTEGDLVKMNRDLKTFLTATDSKRVPMDQRRDLTKAWFEEVVAPLDQTTKNLLRLNWNPYCEAKILELASHPSFAKLTLANAYEDRPSPHQLCESYYEAQNYFVGDSCLQNKDYFTCLWMEGVYKSGSEEAKGWIKPIFDSADLKEKFQRLLISEEAVMSSLIKLEAVTNTTIRETVRKEIYENKLFFLNVLKGHMPITTLRKVCEKIILDPELKNICETAFAAKWKTVSAQKLIEKVDLHTQLVKDVPDHPEIKPIIDAAKYFGFRNNAGGPKFSNSDLYFHRLTEPNKIEAGTLTSILKIGPAEEAAIQKAFLGRIYREPSPDDALTEANMKKAITDLEDERAAKIGEANKLVELANEALTQGIRAATDGDIAFAFQSYDFQVKHFGNIVRATLTFASARDYLVEACYDKVKQEPLSPCPAELDGKSSKKIQQGTLNLNPGKGRIDFSFLMNDPVAVGFKHTGKKAGDYFVDLQPEQLKDTLVRFEFYPNRLQGSTDILTGKSLFIRDGIELYEAGLSAWENG